MGMGRYAVALGLLVGCTPDVEGSYSGSWTRTDAAMKSVRLEGNRGSLIRTSGTHKEEDQRVVMAPAGEGAFSFALDSCKLEVGQRGDELVGRDQACVCPIGGGQVEGKAEVAGRARDGQLRLEVTVALGGPSHSGGCSYVFVGRRVP